MKTRWVVKDEDGRFVEAVLMPRPSGCWWASQVPDPVRPGCTYHRVWGD